MKEFLSLLVLATLSCICISVSNGTYTWSGTTPVGGLCKNDSDCLGGTSTTCCNEHGLCWCLEDLLMVPIEDEIFCLSKATQIGEECMDSIQCQQGEPGSLSECGPSDETPGKFTCNCTVDAIYQAPSQRCYPRAHQIGDGCTVQRQCTINLGENSFCNSQARCDCNLNSIPNDLNTTCLTIRDHVGEECEVKEQCSLGNPGQYSDCFRVSENSSLPFVKICNCTDEAIYDSATGTDECYLRRMYIDEDCDIDKQCSINLGRLGMCNDQNLCKCNLHGIPNYDGNFCLPKATAVGEPCVEPQQCQNGAPGEFSMCTNSTVDPEKHVCQCTEEAVKQPAGEVCLELAKQIGDSCREDIQCTMPFGLYSECTPTNTCECISAVSVPSIGNDACLPIVNDLGGICKENLQCLTGEPGPLSVCENGHCACSPDATSEPNDNLCRPKAGFIGGSCTVNSQCKNNLGNLSECTGGNCACTPGYGIPSLNRLQCLPIVHFIGIKCVEPQQCTSGTPGNHSDCLVTSNGQKVCNCTSDSIHEPGEHICYQKASSVGDNCDIDAQCYTTLGEFSQCITNQCSCITGKSIPNSANTFCLPIRDQLDLPCEDPRQCQLGAPGEFSNCSRSDVFPFPGVCKCTENAVSEPDKHVCHKKASQIPAPCIFDGQCTPNLGNFSRCSDNGVCECKSGAVPNTNKDYCIPGGVLISKPCFDHQQCVGIPEKTSICSGSRICDCLRGYVATTVLDDCLPVLNKIGDECIERQQCQQGDPGINSDCLPSVDAFPKLVCNCTDESVTEAGQDKCHVKAKLVGDPCEVNIQCVANLGYSQCLNNVCHCYSNTTASSDNSKCLSKLNLGEHCIDKNQCSHIAHSTCLDESNECGCEIGYVVHPVRPNVCMQLANQIGDSCTEHITQCSGLQDSVCNETSKTCECEDDFVVGENGTKCLEKANNLGDICEESKQCQAENSECLPNTENRNVCACKHGEFVESEGLPKKCLKVAYDLGDSCTEHQQCTFELGSKTECRGQICQCHQTYVDYNGLCVIAIKLGGSCQLDDECKAGINRLAYCEPLNHTCDCLSPAFSSKNSCWENKVIGSPCSNTEECKITIIGPTVCSQDKNTCQCETGFESTYNGALCSGSATSCITHVLLVALLALSLSSLDK